MGEVLQQSSVGASADAVWAHATSAAGVNAELAPWLRMTVPRGATELHIDRARAGEQLGRSWLLLLGIVPFDYDAIGIAELEPGRRFLEESTMLSMRRWSHERTITPGADGAHVTDRVRFQLRRPLASVPGLDRALQGVVAALFRHRHRRLVALLAASSGPGA